MLHRRDAGATITGREGALSRNCAASDRGWFRGKALVLRMISPRGGKFAEHGGHGLSFKERRNLSWSERRRMDSRTQPKATWRERKSAAVW